MEFFNTNGFCLIDRALPVTDVSFLNRWLDERQAEHEAAGGDASAGPAAMRNPDGPIIGPYSANVLLRDDATDLDRFVQNPRLMPFVNALPHRLQATVDAYTQLALAAGPGAAGALARQLLKCVLAMSGTGLELMKELPGSCWSCGSVTPYLEFFRGVLLQQASYSLPDAEGEGGRGALEPLLVHAMLYIMQVLKAEENATADVISAASPEGAHVTAAAAAGQAEALEAFFSVGVITEMLSLSVCRWLVLTAAEVQASQDEPETFIQEQEDLWYEKDVVPCAESLLCARFAPRPAPTLPRRLGILRQLIDAPSVAEPVSADRPLVKRLFPVVCKSSCLVSSRFVEEVSLLSRF